MISTSFSPLDEACVIFQVPVAGMSLRILTLKKWVNWNLSHSFHWEYAPPWTLGASRLNFLRDGVLPMFS